MSLSDGLFNTIFKWTEMRARTKNVPYISRWEFISFLSIFAGTELINLPLEEGIGMLQGFHLNKGQQPQACGKTFISKTRYLQILKLLTAIDPDELPAAAQSDEWLSEADSIMALQDFETSVYLQCRRMFLNAFSTLVLDDELIGCQSKSVQSFACSDKKSKRKGGFKTPHYPIIWAQASARLQFGSPAP